MANSYWSIAVLTPLPAICILTPGRVNAGDKGLDVWGRGSVPMCTSNVDFGSAELMLWFPADNVRFNHSKTLEIISLIRETNVLLNGRLL